MQLYFHSRLWASRNFHGQRPAYINSGRHGRLSRRLRGLVVVVVVAAADDDEDEK